MKAKEYTIYKHTCPEGKVYIGKTSQPLNNRWRKGSGYMNNKYFFAAINKYGWENITHEVLYTGLTKEEASQKEIELIALYKTQDRRYGYNIFAGGELSSFGIHREVSETTREKMRESAYWKTHKISEETKRKMSEAKKGKPARNKKRVVCKGNGEIYPSITEAAKSLNICPSAISNCLKGLSKSAGGYQWSYE